MNAALLVLCSTTLVIRQDSGMSWAGIAVDKRVNNKDLPADGMEKYRKQIFYLLWQRYQTGDCGHSKGTEKKKQVLNLTPVTDHTRARSVAAMTLT